jgi:hypothetical protein
MNEDGRICSMFKILVCKQEKIPLHTPTYRWESNSKLDPRQIGCKEVNQTSSGQDLAANFSVALKKLTEILLITKLPMFYQTQKILTMVQCYKNESNYCKLHEWDPDSS